MKDDNITNSHYLTYTFIFQKVGRMYFLNLGVKISLAFDSLPLLPFCLQMNKFFKKILKALLNLELPTFEVSKHFEPALEFLQRELSRFSRVLYPDSFHALLVDLWLFVAQVQRSISLQSFSFVHPGFPETFR